MEVRLFFVGVSFFLAPDACTAACTHGRMRSRARSEYTFVSRSDASPVFLRVIPVLRLRVVSSVPRRLPDIVFSFQPLERVLKIREARFVPVCERGPERSDVPFSSISDRRLVVSDRTS